MMAFYSSKHRSRDTVAVFRYLTIVGLSLWMTLSAGIVDAQEETILPENSFEAPFEEYSFNGKRAISNWLVGGDATINQNYIRIVNDRASKRGWIYNQAPTPAGEWTLEIKFRISGQGQHLFGDGLAVWVTSTPYSKFSKGGSAFGVPDTIEGFGILFDTYKNAELGSRHKDIMLINNDGKKGMVMHDVLPTGCRSNYRIWEGRDDFSSTQHSIAVIDFSYSKKTINVRIDDKGDGKLKNCFEFKFTEGGAAKLADMSKMHIALSSSTGQLADNHDVLSVRLRNYKDETAGRIVPVVEPKAIENIVDSSVRTYTEAHVGKLEKRIQDLEHEIEHRMDSLADELKAMIGKIQEAEQEDKTRIQELQEKILGDVTDAVMKEAASSIGDVVDEIVEDSMQRQKSEILSTVSRDVQKNARKLMSNVTASDKSWVLPFVILSIMMCVVTGVAYSKWNRYMKTHLP